MGAKTGFLFLAPVWVVPAPPPPKASAQGKGSLAGLGMCRTPRPGCCGGRRFEVGATHGLTVGHPLGHPTPMKACEISFCPPLRSYQTRASFRQLPFEAQLVASEAQRHWLCSFPGPDVTENLLADLFRYGWVAKLGSFLRS